VQPRAVPRTDEPGLGDGAETAWLLPSVVGDGQVEPEEALRVGDRVDFQSAGCRRAAASRGDTPSQQAREVMDFRRSGEI
jgi:hypothetical protein